MANEVIQLLTGVIVEDDQSISLAELLHCCALSAEQLSAMIEYGIVEPLEPGSDYSHWRFSRDSVLRVQTTLRLQRDLDVNLPGAVLAMELLDEIKVLRQLVGYLQRQ